MTNIVVNGVAKKTKPWPNCSQMAMRYLCSEEFAKTVRSYHEQRLDVSTIHLQAKLYREAAQLLASKQQAQTAFEILTEPWWKRALRMFWYQNKPILSAGIGAVSGT